MVASELLDVLLDAESHQQDEHPLHCAFSPNWSSISMESIRALQPWITSDRQVSISLLYQKQGR